MSAVNILIAIVLFSVIILFHELGHFLLAKANGIGVIEFSLGMGPRIISYAKTEEGHRVKFLVPADILKNIKSLRTILFIRGRFFPSAAPV